MNKNRTNSYTHGHHDSVVSVHATRRASEAAAFLLPHIEPGMRLLDFGCGPGTISIDLAAAVYPGGSVVGIDLSDSVIEQAATRAREIGATNITFEVNSVFDTGYESESFDVAYAHQVLQHLDSPVRALMEIKRLLKPGGLVAVREVDWGTMAVWPGDTRIEEFRRLYAEVAAHNGGEPNAGRCVKSWLGEAGFSQVTLSASIWVHADPESCRWWGEQWAERVRQSNIAETALQNGIADEVELESIGNGWLDWLEKPDAFLMLAHVEGLGRK